MKHNSYSVDFNKQKLRFNCPSIELNRQARVTEILRLTLLQQKRNVSVVAFLTKVRFGRDASSKKIKKCTNKYMKI